MDVHTYSNNMVSRHFELFWIFCVANGLKPIGHLLDIISISRTLQKTVTNSASYPISSDTIQSICVWPKTLVVDFGDSGTQAP